MGILDVINVFIRPSMYKLLYDLLNNNSIYDDSYRYQIF